MIQFSFLNPLTLYSTAGLVALCLLGIETLGLQDKPYDWARYLVLASVFPILLILGNIGKKFSVWIQLAGLLCFGWVYFHFSLYSFPQGHFLEILVLAFLTTCFLAFYPGRPGLVALTIFTATLSWALAFKMTFWIDFLTWTKATGHSMIVFILALLVSLVYFRLNTKPALKPSRISNGIAFLIFSLASFRTDQLTEEWCRHHWDAFLGPTYLIQQGGWLLWDVPSQYGFLSILTATFFPAISRHQAFYFVLAIAHFISAVLLFLLLRKYKPGRKGYLFSLFVTLSAIYFMPGWWPTLLGAASRPSTGSYRFIWTYVLGTFLAKSLQYYGIKKPIPSRFYLFFNLSWILGTLWSIESAIYSTCIWLPSYCVFKWRDRKFSVFKDICLGPFASLGFCVMIICFFYLARLHHLPDPIAWVDYVRSFSLSPGFSIVINNTTLVWWLISIFICLSTLLALGFRKNSDPIEIAVLIGSLTMAWSTSSYFMGRSHENNIINIFPVLAFALILALYAIKVAEKKNWSIAGIKAFAFSTFVVCLTGTYGNQQDWKTYLKSLPKNLRLSTKAFIPHANPEVQMLMDQAKISPTDRVMLSGDSLLEIYTAIDSDGNRQWVQNHPTWIPSSPPTLLHPLSEERRNTYLQRFFERRKMIGWIVSRTGAELEPWLKSFLDKKYKSIKIYKGPNWTLTSYELLIPNQGLPPKNDRP